MAKTATVTKTKTATKDANTKTRAKKSDDGAEKKKREPSAYNVFVSKNLKKWNEEHPNDKKGGMAAVAALWADAPENPKRGQPVTKRAPPKAKKEKDDDAKKAPKSKPKAKASAKAKKESESEQEEDDDDEEEKENEIATSDD
ncbi:hypothetical protein B0H10DRAFT_2006963 [Mycena sp. CBHHK59/15]|nr:hypothetical protein B0H10DRAFT_2006963 [Mycena sp. CBHHK59/15]